LGAEGRESLAGICGTVDPATGNTLPIKRQSRGKNTWRKAVACIVKVNDSRFAKRRRSVFLFELFSVARIGYRICRVREQKGWLVSGHIAESS
jgi:hypothetical protein